MYTAIIGDIRSSKEIINRRELHEKLSRTLAYINETYGGSIAAKFLITIGDEFQGLLLDTEYLLTIIQYIQREMYPVEFRFGVGIGDMVTDINPEAAIGAEGPAFYAARNMINELRGEEKKLKKQAADIRIEIYERPGLSTEEINTMLSLMKVVEGSWTEKQRLTIWDMAKNGGSQELCAKRMNTSQSTVARRLTDGNYIIYEKTKEILNKALKLAGNGE